MSSLDYLELCRLCLVKDNVSLPIFEDEGDERQIYFKISSCLPVKVLREDKLPKKICDECGYKVELLYQFWNTSVNAEKQLLQWLGEVGGLEDKQDFVTEVLDPSVLKQDRSGNTRLDGNVLQVSGQGNIDINMIDNMSIITIPAGSEQQFTTVPMDTSVVQAVAGPSTQVTHEQLVQSQADVSQIVGEESEEDNYDDGCDNDDGMAVKEETEEDHNEQSTFANVSLPCDEAGPSGLQQSELTAQTADGDHKSGSLKVNPSNTVFILKSKQDLSRYRQFSSVCIVPAVSQRTPPKIKITKTEILTRVQAIPVVTKIAGQSPRKPAPVNQVTLPTIVARKNEPIANMACAELPTFNPAKIKKQPVTIVPVRQEKPAEPSPPGVSNSLIEEITDHDSPLYEEIYEEAQQEKDEAEYAEEENYEEEKDEEDVPSSSATVKRKRRKREPGQEATRKSNRSIVSFKCEVCNVTFPGRGLYSEHMQSHSNVRPFECRFCYTTFKRNIHLKRHIRAIHGSEVVKHACDRCTYEAETMGELRRHVLTSHMATVVCRVCERRFTDDEALAAHDCSGPQSRIYACDVCDRCFSSRLRLRVHMVREHKQEQEVFQCELCHRYLASAENLRRHQLIQCSVFNCDRCKRNFQRRDYFVKHVSMCNSYRKPSYQCDNCTKEYDAEIPLKLHMLQCKKARPFKCQDCSKTFTTRASACVHRRWCAKRSH